MRLPIWINPMLWPALWQMRRARRASAEYRTRRARRRTYGCTCGRVVMGSPAARRLRAFKLCPQLGCTKHVSTTRTA